MSVLPPVQGRKTADELLLSIENNNLSHAYIFHGAQGLGKREVASYFAQALLCREGRKAPCGVCESCVQAQGRNNPDIKIYSLKDLSDKKSVGVAEIRDVIADVYTKPFKAQYKIYIIEDGDALTVAAQNAMLKILEEPPEYVVFIICVTSLGRILTTVQSRSRTIRFTPCLDDEVRLYIKSEYPHMQEKADFAVFYCDGILKKVHELFGDERVFHLRSRAGKIFEVLMTTRDEMQVLQTASEFDEIKEELAEGTKSATGEDFLFVLNLILSFAMDVLKVKSGVLSGIVNRDMSDLLNRVSKSVTYEKVRICCEKIITAQEMLSRNVSFKSMALFLCIGIWNA